MTAGQKYPFAPVGATLPGGLRIERRKLRGETSEGMLCSARELGLGQDGEGIWALDTDAAPGTRLLDALPLADHRLVVDVGPNRPDLLGAQGHCPGAIRRVRHTLSAASYSGCRGDRRPARQPGGASTDVGGVHVAIEDPDGCPRLLGAVVRGLKVAPSPAWLAQRLEAVGIRAINNVVDATNYVMLELNQPMHAYDIARLRGPSVIARRARKSETVTTLDGIERKLTSNTQPNE